MTVDLFNIIASAVSILSFLFAAWTYHRSRIMQKNHEIENAALIEQLRSVSRLSVVALHSIQHLIRYCDDEDIPTKNVQEVARQTRINIAGIAELSEITSERVRSWQLANAFGSDLGKHAVKPDEATETRSKG